MDTSEEKEEETEASVVESDSGSDLDMRPVRQVHYEERNGVPGLFARRRCMMAGVSPWTRVKPSNISSRTRS